MSKRIECAGLQIDEALHSLLVQDIAPGTGIEPDQFWQGLADIWTALGPENKRLLAERDSLQAQIDEWHRSHRGRGFRCRGLRGLPARYRLSAPRARALHYHHRKC